MYEADTLSVRQAPHRHYGPPGPWPGSFGPQKGSSAPLCRTPRRYVMEGREPTAGRDRRPGSRGRRRAGDDVQQRGDGGEGHGRDVDRRPRHTGFRKLVRTCSLSQQGRESRGEQLRAERGWLAASARTTRTASGGRNPGRLMSAAPAPPLRRFPSQCCGPRLVSAPCRGSHRPSRCGRSSGRRIPSLPPPGSRRR